MLKTLILTLTFAIIGTAQQTLPGQPALPTYVGGGAAFNQLGTPRVNLFAAAVYPVASSAGVYMSTATDLIPVSQIDPATKRTFYTFQTSIRQGAHKIIFTRGTFTALLGGDAGVGLSQAASGLNVGFNGSFTATGIFQLSKSFALMVPIRGMYVGAGGWNLVPEIGILFKP